MNTSQILLYLIASLFLAWITLYTFSASRRAKQWLVATTTIGIGWLPLYVMLANVDISVYTTIPTPWNMLELAAVSGLAWGIFSALLVARSAGAIKSPVKVNMKKVVLSYTLFAITLLIALITSFSSAIAGIALFGAASLILTLNRPRALLMSLLTALAVSIILIGISIGIPALNQLTTLADNQIAGFQSIAGVELIIFIAISALIAPVIANWWLEQSTTPTTNAK